MDNCIFCKIVSGQIPVTPIDELPDAILIKDKNPIAPHHVLAVSKEHIAHIGEVVYPETILDMYALLCKYASDNGLDKTGFRIVANTGPDAGQTVHHFHMHLLGGGTLKNDFGA